MRRHMGVALLTWAIAFSLLAVANALPSPPTAVLTVDDPTPFPGEPVHFDASESIPHDEGNGVIVAYRFDFGDRSGTDWQASPFAEHAYSKAGTYEATVEVKDRRDLVGHDTTTISVRATPPPTGQAPDLVPVAASVSPAKPKVDDVVTLAVTIMNQGGTAAQSASADVVDERPSGADILVDTLELESPLEPGTVAVLLSSPFLAVEEGNHTMRITVRAVSPPETRTGDNVLVMKMQVLPRTNGGGGPGGQGTALVLNPVVLGLIGAAIVALVGALAFLARPVEIQPLTPPPAEPPDRRPPPIWPP